MKDAVRLIGGDIYGYRPASARLYGLFQSNPFGVYAFVARHHWAVRTALGVIRDELTNDGFQLRGDKTTTKKRIKDVYRLLKQMGIFNLRIDLATHIKLYGNAWVLPHRNLLGSPQAFELLAPPKLLPIIDPMTEQITGWEYTVGKGTVKYSVKRVLHLFQYSADNHRQLGDPPLAPAILGIEADLAADSFNNQMFQKGGMMGVIVNIKAPEGDPIGRDDEDMVDDLQDKIDAQFTGNKAAHSMLITTGVDKVFPITEFGKLDASFQTLHMETAKTVANCLGVPPEKRHASIHPFTR
jgi:phage portal protein BeeE